MTKWILPSGHGRRIWLLPVSPFQVFENFSPRSVPPAGGTSLGDFLFSSLFGGGIFCICFQNKLSYFLSSSVSIDVVSVKLKPYFTKENNKVTTKRRAIQL